jgi:hypothetical protein
VASLRALLSLIHVLVVPWPSRRPRPQSAWRFLNTVACRRGWGRGEATAGQIIGYRRDGRPIRLGFGAAGPAVVQTQTNSGSSVTTLTVTLTGTGSLNSVIATVTGNGPNFASTVELGATPLSLAVQKIDSNSTAVSEIWYLDGIASGQTSLTVSWASANSSCQVHVREVSGLLTTGSLDRISSGQLDSATSPLSWTSGSTATLSQASEIAVGCTAQIGLPGTVTPPGSPWVSTQFPASGSRQESSHNIVSATTALAYAGSTTHSGTLNTSTCIATFKAAPAAAAAAPPPRSTTAMVRASYY